MFFGGLGASVRRSLSAALASSACAALAVLSFSTQAFADDQPVPKPRPTPPDTRSWSPRLAFQLGTEQPLGSAETNRVHYDNLSFGMALGLSVVLPVARHVGFEAWGYQGKYNGTVICPSCTAETKAYGLGIVYYLLDGTPLEPWFSAGVGYRSSEYKPFDRIGTNLSYTGVVIPRLVIGADYWFSRFIGIGVYTNLTFGTYLARDPGYIREGNGEIHSFWGTGLRLVAKPF